jgi:hypothetical protein
VPLSLTVAMQDCYTSVTAATHRLCNVCRMKRVLLAILCAGLIGATANPPSLAQGKGKGQGQGQGKGGWSFQRVGTFANYTNASIDDTTVSEVIAASADGRTLVYTDAGRGTPIPPTTSRTRPRPSRCCAISTCSPRSTRVPRRSTSAVN